MSTEIELKLALSPAAARALPEHPRLQGLTGTRQRLISTYYDTPELALKARRAALRLRQRGWQWLLAVKSAEPASGGLALRDEWETPATPGVWDFTVVEAPALRDFLEKAVPRLTPIFTTHFRRTAWQVSEGESLIELALDQGFIESAGRRQMIREVELELVHGRIGDLFALACQLQSRLALRPSPASKAERGYALFANLPLRPFKARPPTLSAETRPDAAFRQIALACLEQFQRNEMGIISGEKDPEFVHQARVALRRLRSALKVFGPVLPENYAAVWEKRWKALADALGEARNWDVFIGETLPPLQSAFPDDRHFLKVLASSRHQARRAYAALCGLLSREETPRQTTEFTASLFALPDINNPSLQEFALADIARIARRARKLALRHARLTPEERHRMRLAFKRLRYTLEFFSPLLPPRRLKAYLAALARLQDELGRINDHITAAGLAHRLGASGPLPAWIAGRHALLVTQLPESLRAFLEQPWEGCAGKGSPGRGKGKSGIRDQGSGVRDQKNPLSDPRKPLRR